MIETVILIFYVVTLSTLIVKLVSDYRYRAAFLASGINCFTFALVGAFLGWPYFAASLWFLVLTILISHKIK